MTRLWTAMVSFTLLRINTVEGIWRLSWFSFVPAWATSMFIDGARKETLPHV